MGEGERGRHPAKCSFCGKRQDQVRKLVAGPGVFICDPCIRLCNEILDEDASSGCAGTGTPTPSPGSESAWRRFLAGRWRNWRLVL